jgi:hypothetical protein
MPLNSHKYMAKTTSRKPLTKKLKPTPDESEPDPCQVLPLLTTGKMKQFVPVRIQTFVSCAKVCSTLKLMVVYKLKFL